jgi:hypothetical protein
MSYVPKKPLQKLRLLLRFEVLTVVKMMSVVFWVVMPCSLEHNYQGFGGTHHLHLYGGRCVPPKWHQNPEDYN